MYVQWNVYIKVTFGTQPSGCCIEVACLERLSITLGKSPLYCIFLHKSNQQSENKYNSTKCNPKSINGHVCPYELDHRVECMASHIVVESSCHEWSSYVRGYQVYQAVWIPAMGEMLRLAVEPTNSHDTCMYAVAVMQVGYDGTVRVVGHLPRNSSRVISFFLKKNESAGYCKVTGERTNRGAGLGLEILCIYRFYGHQPYVDRLKNLLS